MISFQTLLHEIEQLVVGTKKSTNEQHIREQLSAIRALCNVALSNGKQQKPHQVQSVISTVASQSGQSFQASPLMQSHNVIQNANSVNSPKLQEEDANGESIFDF